MPPEGYETVTLPTELVEQLDEYGDEMGVSRRSDAIRALLEDRNTDQPDLQEVTVTDLDDSVRESLVSDIANRTTDMMMSELP